MQNNKSLKADDDAVNSETSTPLVSVIVVTYRQEDTLGRTLDSILAQRTDFPIEILVSDDCSPDGTPSVGEKYARRYPGIVKFHSNPHNLGVQGNYFGALRRARGKYIADCAGDDFWTDPLKLSKEVALLEHDPAITVVHTGWEYNYPDGKRKTFQPPYDYSSGEQITVDLPESNLYFTAYAETGAITGTRLLSTTGWPPLHLCTALYRRDAALKVLDDNLELFMNPDWGCEDLQLSTELCFAGKTAYIPYSTLAYSVGNPSISSDENYAKTFDFYFGVLRLLTLLLKKHNVEATATLEKIAHFLTAQAFRAKSKERMRKIVAFMKSEGLAPTWKGRIYRILSPIVCK